MSKPETGNEHSGTGAEYPATWRNWPKEQRIEYLRMSRKRDDLLDELLAMADREKDEEMDDYRLNKEEVAALYDVVFEHRY